MSGDPSRRPSNERVRLPGVDTLVTIQCRSCFGDGWFRLSAYDRYKRSCEACAGSGRAQIPALERRTSDVTISERPA